MQVELYQLKLTYVELEYLQLAIQLAQESDKDNKWFYNKLECLVMRARTHHRLK